MESSRFVPSQKFDYDSLPLELKKIICHHITKSKKFSDINHLMLLSKGTKKFADEAVDELFKDAMKLITLINELPARKALALINCYKKTSYFERIRNLFSTLIESTSTDTKKLSHAEIILFALIATRKLGDDFLTENDAYLLLKNSFAAIKNKLSPTAIENFEIMFLAMHITALSYERSATPDMILIHRVKMLDEFNEIIALPKMEAALISALRKRTNNKYINLTGINLSHSQLIGDYQNCNLAGADLSNASIRGNFNNCNFSESKWESVNISLNSTFENACLTNAKLHTSMCQINLKNADLTNATCTFGHFLKANLENVVFVDVKATSLEFASANTKGMRFLPQEAFTSVEKFSAHLERLQINLVSKVDQKHCMFTKDSLIALIARHLSEEFRKLKSNDASELLEALKVSTFFKSVETADMNILFPKKHPLKSIIELEKELHSMESELKKDFSCE